jgi:hypothetical protein
VATIVVHSVGSASRDYSTVQAWANAAPANLVTADQVWKGECYNDSEFLVASGDLLNLTTTTSDATRYMWLTTAAGHSFRDNSGKSSLPLRYNQSKGVGLRATDNYGNLFRVALVNYLVENLQLYHDKTAHNSGALGIQGTNLTFKNCIIESRVASDALYDPNHATTFINCVLMSSGTAQAADFLGGPGKFFNCTAVRPADLAAGTGCFNAYYGTFPLVKNTVVFGFGAAPFAGTLASYVAGTGNNASGAASGSMPGTGNQGSLTYASQFQNVNNATRDWRPVNTGAIYNTGTRDATNTADVDIIGTARSTSTPAIGAREFEVVAVPAPAVENVGSRVNRVGRGPYSKSGYLRPKFDVFGRNNWYVDIADASAAADASTGQVVAPADGADSTSAADVSFNVLAQLAAGTDAVTADGTSASAFASALDGADVVTAADAATTLGVFVAAAADVLTLADLAASILVFLKEVENLGDRRNRPGRGPYSLGGFFRPTLDVYGRTVFMSDAADPGAASDTADTVPQLDAADAISIVESTTGILVMLTTAASPVTAIDTANSDSGSDILATDSSNVLDSSSTLLTGQVVVIDVVALDDSSNPRFAFTAAAADAATLGEFADSRTVVTSAPAFDAVAASDVALGFVLITRAAVDAINAFDDANAISSADINTDASDAIALSDSATSLRELIRHIHAKLTKDQLSLNGDPPTRPTNSSKTRRRNLQ